MAPEKILENYTKKSAFSCFLEQNFSQMVAWIFLFSEKIVCLQYLWELTLTPSPLAYTTGCDYVW